MGFGQFLRIIKAMYKSDNILKYHDRKKNLKQVRSENYNKNHFINKKLNSNNLIYVLFNYKLYFILDSFMRYVWAVKNWYLLEFVMIDPLFSIIVPVYNSCDSLSRCIRHIVNQDFKNYELLLIDDGSTDDSGAICDEYALKCDRVNVFHKQNGGVSTARNME